MKARGMAATVIVAYSCRGAKKKRNLRLDKRLAEIQITPTLNTSRGLYRYANQFGLYRSVRILSQHSLGPCRSFQPL